MSSMVRRSAMLAIILAGTWATSVYGIVPPQTVYYRLHEVPDDPTSALTFIIRLDLTAIDVAGNSIAWSVDAVEISQLAAAGSPVTVWTDYLAYVDTPDGLWWVDHADPVSPNHAEFVLPPGIMGAAIAQYPGESNLDYTLNGVVYVAPSKGAPYEVTGAIDFNFTLQVTQTLVAAGDDEPIDVPDPIQDPSYVLY